MIICALLLTSVHRLAKIYIALGKGSAYSALQKTMKKRSIFRQILFPVFLLILILVGIILALIWTFVSRNSQEQILTDNAESTSVMADDISIFLSKAYALSYEIAENPSVLTMDTGIQTPILEGCAERNPFFELLYIQGSDGMQTGRSSGELADRSTRWWFLQTMEEKQPFISKSYYSVNTNMPCTSVFIPMYAADDAQRTNIIGIMAADIKLDFLTELVREMSGSGKIPFILDGEGTVVAHPEASYIEELYNYKTLTRTVSKKDGSGNVVTDADGNIVTEEEPLEVSEDFAAVIESVMGGNAGSRLIDYDDERYFVSYSPVDLDGSSDSWSVVTLQSYSGAMAGTLRLMFVLICVSVAILAVIVIIIAILIRRISAPIMVMSDIVSEASEGNFTLRAQENGSRELNVLAASFNRMLGKLSDILYEMMDVIAGVGASRTELGDISRKFGDVANAISEISVGAGRQKESVGNAALFTEDMGKAYGELRDNSGRIVTEATHITHACQGGMEHIRLLDSQNQENQSEMQNAYEKMETLSRLSAEVGKIVGEISNISSQTGMLSLNASIEAARAGEQGRGFAVVADQVGKLAESTKRAASMVSDIIGKLQEAIAGTLEHVTKVRDGIEEQQDTVTSVKDAINDFEVSSEKTLAAVQEMTGQIEDLSRRNNQMIVDIDNIRRISESVSTRTGEVTAIVQEQRDEIVRVEDKVSKLSELSEKLSRDLSKFTMKAQS